MKKFLTIIIIYLTLNSYSFIRLDDTNHHGDSSIGSGTWLIRGGYWPKQNASDTKTTVTVYLDQDGDLVHIDDEDAIVQEAFDVWNNVEESNIELVIGGKIKRDDIGSDTQFIFYDTDGSIMLENGVDESSLNAILGFAFPYTSGNSDSGMYTNSIIVLNGQLIGSDNELKTTLIHEMGHFLGLDHSGIYDDDSIPTMYSQNITSHGNQFVLKQDDEAGVSEIYPEESFYKNLGAIKGQVNFYDGSPAYGVHVVAIDANTYDETKKTAKINDKAVSSMTGFPLCFSSSYYTNEAGEFIIPGLEAGYYFVMIESFPLDGNSGFQIEDEGIFQTGSGIGGYDFGVFDAGFNNLYFDNVDALADAKTISVVANTITTDVDFQIGKENTLLIGSYFRHNDSSKSIIYEGLTYRVTIGSTTLSQQVTGNNDKFFTEIKLEEDFPSFANYLPPAYKWYLEIYNKNNNKKINPTEEGIVSLFVLNAGGKTYSMANYYEAIKSNSTFTIDGNTTKEELADRNLSFDPNCNPVTKSGEKEDAGTSGGTTPGSTTGSTPADTNGQPTTAETPEEDGGCSITNNDNGSKSKIVIFIALLLLIGLYRIDSKLSLRARRAKQSQ